jgi:hypothetical protein
VDFGLVRLEAEHVFDGIGEAVFPEEARIRPVVDGAVVLGAGEAVCRSPDYPYRFRIEPMCGAIMGMSDSPLKVAALG